MSSLRRNGLWLVVALIALTPSRAHARPLPRDTMFVHGEFLDPIAAVLKLSLLRQQALPEGQREIRIWVEGGQDVTGKLVRLTIDKSGRVAGSLAVFWMFDPSEMGAYGGRIADQLKARYGCRTTVTHDVTRENVPLRAGACVATFKKVPRWTNLAMQLDTLGVWTLPEQPHDSTRTGEMETQASVVIETRHGDTYQFYHYANVRTLTTDDAKQAARILDLALDIEKAADRGVGIPPK